MNLFFHIGVAVIALVVGGFYGILAGGLGAGVASLYLKKKHKR
jgi:uncharacterized ion transporter superfamily protein YfcC